MRRTRVSLTKCTPPPVECYKNVPNSLEICLKMAGLGCRFFMFCLDERISNRKRKLIFVNPPSRSYLISVYLLGKYLKNQVVSEL